MTFCAALKSFQMYTVLGLIDGKIISFVQLDWPFPSCMTRCLYSIHLTHAACVSNPHLKNNLSFINKVSAIVFHFMVSIKVIWVQLKHLALPQPAISK